MLTSRDFLVRICLQANALIKCADAAAITVESGIFGPGSGPVFLDELDCRGNETDLNDCSHNNGNSNCFHREDAGVICPQGV